MIDRVQTILPYHPTNLTDYFLVEGQHSIVELTMEPLLPPLPIAGVAIFAVLPGTGGKMVSHSLLLFSPLPVLRIGKTKSEACHMGAIHIDFSPLMQSNAPEGYTESAEFRDGSTNKPNTSA